MCPPDLSHFGSKASIDEAITSHFLEWVSPEPLSGARNWFRAVVEISSESDLLGPAVQAISSQFFALQCNDYALLRESQRLHVMTLAKLRQDIAEPSSEAGYFALYTTLLLVFYEVLSLVRRAIEMLMIVISLRRSKTPSPGWSTLGARRELSNT